MPKGRSKPPAPLLAGFWLVRMRPLHFALLVYLLALLPRLAFVLAAGRGDLSLDEIEYHLLAQNLAEGRGYRWFFDIRSSFRPPGFPFFLAGVYWLFGPDYFIARIAQSLFGAAIGLATWLAGRQIFPERIARWGGVMASLYPPLVCFSVALMSENLFIPLLLLLLYFLPRMAWSEDRGKRAGMALAAGLAAGTGILMRPELTYLLPLLLGWVLCAGGSGIPEGIRRQVWAAAGVVMIVFVMVAPWCVRNYQLTGRFVYLDTRAGYNLYLGYNEEAKGTFDLEQAQDLIDEYIEANLQVLELPEPLSKAEVRELLFRELVAYKHPEALEYPLRKQFNPDAALSDIVMHDWGKERALQFIHAHPLRSLLLVPMKVAYFWDLEHRIFLFAYSNDFLGPLPRLVLALFLFVLLAPFAFICLLAVPGALWLSRSQGIWLFVCPIVFYSGLHGITFGEARFHYVIVPLLCLLAAQGASLVYERKPIIKDKKRLYTMIAIIVLLLTAWVHGLCDSRERWEAVFSRNGNQSRLEF